VLRKTLLRIFTGLVSAGIACIIAAVVFFSSTSDPLVPNGVIQGFIKSYQPKELERVNLDLESIKHNSFYDKNPVERPVYIEHPTYVASAGGPGASKTTILEAFMENKSNFVYIDPDHSCLKYMYIYRQELSNLAIKKALAQDQKNGYQALLRDAYNKWRGASNYISNTLLNEAFTKKYNIMHGTTSTAPTMEEFYKKLKKQGYRIVLVLCGSTDENRKNSLEFREKELKFYQSNFDDYVDKGKLFYQRFPIYFKYADEIHFFWTEEFRKGSEEVAILDRETGFKVINQKSLDKFIAEYRGNSKGLPPFEDLVKLVTLLQK